MILLEMKKFMQKIGDRKNLLLIILIGAIFIFILSLNVAPAYLFGALAILALLIFFIRYTEFGLYLIVFLYPFNYLQLFIGEINAPYVDFIGMFVFFAWGARSLWLHIAKKEKLGSKNFPGLLFFILFFIASSLSLLNVENLFSGVKYILRPLTFFYLIFLLLPYNLIKSRETLFKVFKVLFAVGIFVSLMGLWSFIFPETKGLFRRALPISIFGIRPLGTNHNLIAEVLVSVIPITLILFWRAKDLAKKNLYFFGLFLMGAINLLTFSRTGWLVLFLELTILILARYQAELKKFIFSYRAFLLLFLVIPAAVYMYYFILSPEVRGSNLARLELTKIALDMFYHHPYIGNGVGTFIEEVSRNRWYILDFGNPMEAHGVAQKLLAETGIFGFVTFFSLLVYILWRLIKTYRSIEPASEWKYIILALILSASGSIVFQFFHTSYFASKMWLPLGIALAATKLVPRGALKRIL